MGNTIAFYYNRNNCNLNYIERKNDSWQCADQFYNIIIVLELIASWDTIQSNNYMNGIYVLCFAYKYTFNVLWQQM